MNLLLLEPSAFDAGGVVMVTGRQARHLIDVLRVTSGSVVRVGLVDGPRGVAEVRTVTPDAVELACRFEIEIPDRPPIDLLLALPRPKVLRRLWAQMAALGVGQILLTNAERVERNYFDTHVLSADGYRPLLIEGLEQARDTRVPVVSVHRRFKVLVEDHLDALCPETHRFIADPGGWTAGSTDVDARSRVLLAVGPEGGWNDYERDLLLAHGFRTLSIGMRTLRTDTAVIALLTVMHQTVAVGRLSGPRPPV